MPEKSTPLTHVVLHKLGKSFKEEALGITLIAITYVGLCRLGFIRFSWALVMTFAAFVGVVYYGWLTQEHPDKAERFRLRWKARILNAWAHVLGGSQWISQHVGKITHLSGEPSTPRSIGALTNDARAVQEDRAANPRSVPQGTKLYEAMFAGVTEPLGAIEDYQYEESTGNKFWRVALPSPWTADDFAKQFKSMFVSAASTSSDAVHIRAFQRRDGVVDESRAMLVIEDQAMRKPIASGEWPLLAAPYGSLDLADGVPVGIKASGIQWVLELVMNHIFAAGLTRWGKSAFLRDIIAGVVLMKNARLWVIDPKGVDYVIWDGVMDRYAHKTDEFEPFLLDALIEMERRLNVLRDMRRTKWKATVEHPQLVIVIDEAADIPMAMQRELLVPLIQKGAGAGITVVAATVRFTGDQIDTTFRSQFNTVVGFKTKDDAEMRIILGPGINSHGVTTKRIKQRGECWVDEGETFAFARTYYIEDEGVAPYADRIALERRGQNPGSPVSVQAEPRVAENAVGNPETPEAVTSPKGAEEGPTENAVNEPPELWTLPGRAPAVWRVLASATAEGRAISKAEIARLVGQAERGEDFDKGTLAKDFKALEDGKWMRAKHGPTGVLQGFVATVPDGIEYDA